MNDPVEEPIFDDNELQQKTMATETIQNNLASPKSLISNRNLLINKYSIKYGYIEKTDKKVIPFKYNHAGPFSEGLAFVGLNSEEDGEGVYFYIDKTGKCVKDCP
jgi:hypothetical protein